ncbi:sugar phosphate isomerase/epimerase family protein [Novipirellula artificiosorum]|uniref:Xylose isomerase-like TIM barrel n=1 Tax=Novipirellula artificiosorum TaxID=2528016 RepID=A0A5C6DX63_9BACT|nr:sugar phosphate isomerase/epimerase family protein [Novipirellula artificiosorum]TWU42023.1 Xylose isomerase-like TIM barrel [Novipirellula artificiosorum]
MIQRRQFLQRGIVATAAGASWMCKPQRTALLADEPNQDASSHLPIGSCRIGLQQAVAAGIDGVEVRVGNAAERLEIADPKTIAKYKEEMQQTGLVVRSLMMGLLNQNPLATDPRGPAWLEQSITAAKQLGAPVILVAFFGKGNLLEDDGRVKQDDVARVVQRLKAAAPLAKEAGVILAIENYFDGEQNERLLDRIDHDSVQVYYDVYNTGTTKGHDVPADIHRLRDRIAQFHFKNGNHFLDHEKEKFEPIAAAVNAIGFQGWAVLETSDPTGDAIADTRRNADFLRGLLG